MFRLSFGKNTNTPMKRSRDQQHPKISRRDPKEKEDEEDDFEDEDEEELMAEARAVGMIGAGGGGGGGGGGRGPPATNNKSGLLEAYRTVAEDLPWIERLEVVSADPIVGVSAADDLKLELAFYSQSLAAVSAARGELERLGVPHRRPTDFLAEMLKTDGHMKRVKDKLLLEQERLTAVETRRRQKEAEKFRKAAHAERLKDKAKEKRTDLDATKQWRKHGVVPEGKDAVRAAARKGGKFGGGGVGGREDGKPNFKRAKKDEKFGFGGVKKRTLKENDKRSSQDMSGFSVNKMKKGGGGGAKGGKRPGKFARAAKHGKK